MINFFNKQSFYNAEKEVKFAPSGFRFGFIPDVFKEEAYFGLVKSFPDVSKFKLVNKQSGGGLKRFYAGPVYDSEKDKGCWCHFGSLAPVWKSLVKETDSPEFMTLLKEASGVSFNSLADFGFTYGNEGCVQEAHIDGEVRDLNNLKLPAVACLLYFNPNPDTIGGTCVYGADRETILLKAPHLRNGLFFFEQHQEAWHGFPIMPKGSERRLVSLAYNTRVPPISLNDSFFHKLACVRRHKSQIKKTLGR